MTVIVCLDNKNGMLFAKRRLSKDSVLIKRVLEISKGKRLCINSFSQKLFENQKVFISEDFLQSAQDEDFCFVEDKPLMPYVEKIEKLIVYKWNRTYPSDFKLDICLDNFKLQSSFDFAGSSHEKISEEVYIK